MAPATVLIVDKSHDTRELLYDILHSEGYRCVLAADGLEAMNVLRQAQPDLVITGMNLPTVTGLELLRHIRANAPDTAALVMAADLGREIKETCYKLGAYKVIEKPAAHIDAVVIYAERALERRQLLIERRRRLAGHH